MFSAYFWFQFIFHPFVHLCMEHKTVKISEQSLNTCYIMALCVLQYNKKVHICLITDRKDNVVPHCYICQEIWQRWLFPYQFWHKIFWIIKEYCAKLESLQERNCTVTEAKLMLMCWQIVITVLSCSFYHFAYRYEQPLGKTNNLHRRKQRRRSASQ